MMPADANPPMVAIACGGTGGHLFPGLAVAGQLARRGCDIALIISPKEIDQQAVKSAAAGMKIVTLPAVGLSRGRVIAFVRGFFQSYRAAKSCFANHPPRAALAMGGFTSAPPILAARKLGAQTFLHESNTIPGRANRWLSRFVDRAFVGFPQAAERLRSRSVTVTGTPVRPQFRGGDAAACRARLGFDPALPVLLVMGGSQGASGINDLVVSALPLLAKRVPSLQLLHLAGPNDAGKIRQASAAAGLKAVVHSFFAEMELALGAATLAVSRAGASSLAELAAMRVPSLLVPFPAATDNHQFHNAHAFEETHAAALIEQNRATPETFARQILELLENAGAREHMQSALAGWDRPDAAEQIADAIMSRFEVLRGAAAPLENRRGPARSWSPALPFIL